MSDKDLVEKILQKNEQAFRQFVEQYQSLVLKTCNGFVHDADDAQDIAQDVFIEVYQSIESFRNDAKLSTWLYRIAVNKSLNHLRKNRRKQWVQSIENIFSKGDSNVVNIQASESAGADFHLESNERAKILHEAIHSLPKMQHTAFILNKYEELSYKEIADVMQTSIPSVESLLHRAKLNLQKKLINYYKNF